MNQQAIGTSADSHRSEPAAAQLERRDDVAIIRLDVPGERMNTLSRASTASLRDAFAQAEEDSRIRAIVLSSGKPDNFIAGADVRMLQSCRSASEVSSLSRDMQRELDRIEASRKPVVAAIHGACLGGGLEVALACHYRIATDHPKTQLGLPEVMLGILPGGGGTQRLPQLVGLRAALDLMLTGKNVRAVRAKKLGLVDAVTVPFGLEETAVLAARQLADGQRRRRAREPGPQDRALEQTAAGRAVVFRQARASVLDKTLGNYPAPLAIIDVVEAGCSKGKKRGLEEESRRFGELAMTPAAQSLMGLFFAQNALKKNRFPSSSFTVDTVAVVGAGLMGAGIAAVSVQKGKRVLLSDVSDASLARARKGLYEELQRRVKRRSLSAFERDQLLSKLVTTTSHRGLERADLVVEAVYEDLQLKHEVLRQVEKVVRDDCIIATNTSALPLRDIAKGLQRPENLVGMHYFSPVEKMPLLEVVVGEETSRRAASVAVETGIAQGKTVIVVKDGPGFYTSRVLATYLDEASRLLAEGIDPRFLDHAMTEFGFPVGPITLLDEVGLDVAAHVAHDLQSFFEPRFGPRDTTALDAMVKAGFLGRKSGRGFYRYDASSRSRTRGFLRGAMRRIQGGDSGKPINADAMALLQTSKLLSSKARSFAVGEVQTRMWARFVAEAVTCLQDRILENASDGDVGAVFGLGFPAFRGGPFRFIDEQGASHVVASLERLRDAHGARFAPPVLLTEHAKAGKRFYPDRPS
ncbi:MAG: 3-hydroxyacyl-CoA dehydrogenase NAD-binding domain-containing protein [Myxococcota bacterium]